MLKYYGLREAPFSISPDPRFLYISPQHQSAIAKTKYILENRQGLKVIFGDVGLGKTTLARRIKDGLLDDQQYALSFIPTPRFKSEHQFLCRIAEEFGVSPKRSGLETLGALEVALAGLYSEGKIAALLIDEAQLLVGPQFELLRQLLNFETNSAKLLQIVLVGQNELRAKLRQKRALQSRIAMQSTLEPLAPEDVAELISFRLVVAGREEPLFTKDALDLIYSASGGVPREVIKICMAALPFGQYNKARRIGTDIVGAAIEQSVAEGTLTAGKAGV
jgi:general secretion pathway protein A